MWAMWAERERTKQMWAADKKGSKTNQGEARQNVGENKNTMQNTKAGQKKVWGRCKKHTNKQGNAKQAKRTRARF